ncbi:MAG: hypothetical protein ABID54_07145 [Pseudomonadota bacterium]
MEVTVKSVQMSDLKFKPPPVTGGTDSAMTVIVLISKSERVNT